MKLIRDDFLKYAASCSGIDGGDTNAEYWFMGMEWSNENDLEDDYANDTWTIKKLEDVLIKDISKDIISNPQDWRLEENMAILYRMLMSDTKENIFAKNSNSFKLNLLPLPFTGKSEGKNPHTSWTKNKEHRYSQMTGCRYFDEYVREVLPARYELFQRLLQKNNKPKTIFCFGIGYHKEFLQALLSPTDNKIDEHIKHNNVELLKNFGKNVFVYDDATRIYGGASSLIKRIIVCYFPCPPVGKKFTADDWKQIYDLAIK